MQFTDRDNGLYMLETMDLEPQLLAIRSLLARNRDVDRRLNDDIQDLDARARAAMGDQAEHYVDLWLDGLGRSVYQSAATSTAAVAMLAPLLEGFFVEIFKVLERRYSRLLPSDLAKHRGVPTGHPAWWDARVYFGSKGERKDVALGIAQLARATGLSIYLAADHSEVLRAVFLYRNKMLHNGFEWPDADRASFKRELIARGWPGEWFTNASRANDPWVFYMEDALIDRCFALIDEALVGVGLYTRQLLQQQWAAQDAAGDDLAAT